MCIRDRLKGTCFLRSHPPELFFWGGADPVFLRSVGTVTRESPFVPSTSRLGLVQGSASNESSSASSASSGSSGSKKQRKPGELWGNSSEARWAVGGGWMVDVDLFRAVLGGGWKEMT